MHSEEQIVKLIQNKKFDEALSHLFENLEEDPKEVTNYINAGTILAEANDVERAEKFFQKAITVNESHGGAYYSLANLYYNQQRFEEAIKLYQHAIKRGLNDADTNFMLGMSFNELGAHTEALPYVMRAHELSEDDVEIGFQYGLTLCQLEMFDEAIMQLEKVLEKDSKHVDALYNLGLAKYMKNENAEEALVYFRKAVDIQPDHLLSGHAINMFEQLLEEEG
ncbi:tetratricopeptide repeat protein [Mammaliicoccus sciuri]|uniref:tetratricopeptide repeat protein n=1 Tax=Mammaliicoccus sciuri TaxID=1296 RepID=UPI001D0D1E21|nr:tetratricopeptide repeat protein [Mammaliicoccus sciuri]MCC2089564.1 tetratricopeptide repeat protein [Mammaliicoccus sciuri]